MRSADPTYPKAIPSARVLVFPILFPEGPMNTQLKKLLLQHQIKGGNIYTQRDKFDKSMNWGWYKFR